MESIGPLTAARFRGTRIRRGHYELKASVLFRRLHEIKFDGNRVQVHLRDAAVKVFTRRGKDWTKRFRKIADDALADNWPQPFIDGVKWLSDRSDSPAATC